MDAKTKVSGESAKQGAGRAGGPGEELKNEATNTMKHSYEGSKKMARKAGDRMKIGATTAQHKIKDAAKQPYAKTDDAGSKDEK